MLTLAIVGRPNVGKSRFFNRVVGRRHSIVVDQPGVTRDRVECEAMWRGRRIRWIDTGGIGLQDEFAEAINLQAKVAVEAADAVLFLVDVRDGIVPLDREIASRLRAGRRPVVVVAHKADTGVQDAAAAEFVALGFDLVLPVSSEHGRGVDEAVDAAVLAALEGRRAAGLSEDDEDEVAVHNRVAIVGRPNVGKSSILNRLLGEERVVVSPIPGTTRDAIECAVDLPTGRIVIVDTAGIRKRRSTYDTVERLMVLRTRRAVERADVAVVVCDAVEGFTDQDAKILAGVYSLGRGAVLALNKWDAVPEKAFDKIVASIRRRLGTEAHTPIVSVSALKGQRVRKVFETALAVGEQAASRVRTRDLIRILGEAAQRAPAGMRIKYAHQHGACPPQFLVFGAARPPRQLEQFLRNRIREAGGYEGIPVILEFRR